MTIQTTKSDRLTQSKFITAYGRKIKVQITFSTKGRTKQNHKAECDINNIISSFKRTGTLPESSRGMPRYGDATGIDFQNAQLLVAEAKGMFAELPARVRDRFDNDPGKLMSFLDNPRNRVEAEELGLLQEPKDERQVPQAPTPPPPAPKAAQGAASDVGNPAPKAPQTNSPT